MYVPPEVREKQPSFWENGEKLQVYSLGVVLLKMVYGDKLEEKAIEEQTFNLRLNYSFEFCCLVESMVKKGEKERVTLSNLISRVKELK